MGQGVFSRCIAAIPIPTFAVETVGTVESQDLATAEEDLERKSAAADAQKICLNPIEESRHSWFAEMISHAASDIREKHE